MPTTRTTRTLTVAALSALAVSAGATASAAAAVIHTVHRGETLTSVAAADGLSVDRLAAANGLPPSAELIAGQSLVIPPQSGPVAAPATTSDASWPAATGAATAAPASGGYVVQPGDTLDGIAARLGTTADALAAANGLSVDGLLLAGSTLNLSGLPAATTSTGASATNSTATDSVSPSAESVSPSDVGEIAAAAGVPAALAEAVADQESGFNNAEVSPSGATGVMQIEPSTWNDLSRLRGMRLSPNSATDNIRGGVAILGELLAQTGGDEAQAAAAYYQGMRSLREHGMYPSTQRYVRNVLALADRFGG